MTSTYNIVQIVLLKKILSGQIFKLVKSSFPSLPGELAILPPSRWVHNNGSKSKYVLRSARNLKSVTAAVRSKWRNTGGPKSATKTSNGRDELFICTNE